jgi:tRNA dimethylallyltransferase
MVATLDRNVNTQPAQEDKDHASQYDSAMNRPIVILGCTASGKSDLGEGIAARLGSTVMAVDSMQVYRRMDIGTAKPDAAVRAKIPYRMLDVADPWEAYSAARFAQEARPLIENTKHEPQITKPGPMVLVAGTILYLRALVEGLFEGPSADETLRNELHHRAADIGLAALHAELAAVDPLAAARIHPNDLRRIVRALEVYKLTNTPISTLQTQWTAAHPAIDALYLGIRRDKDSLSRRINARVRLMMQAGLLDEVRRLKDDPRGFSNEAASAVGYRQLLDYFARKVSLDDAVEQIKIQTRHLAKMQRTWLKRWPATGKVHWIDAAENQGGADLVEQAMQIIEQAGKSG